MIHSDTYYNGLSRKYGEKHTEYIPPKQIRLSYNNRKLLKNGLPLILNEGTVDINDRGDLIFTNIKGEASPFINAPPNLTIKYTND